MGLQLKKIGQIPASLGGSVASQKEKPYPKRDSGIARYNSPSNLTTVVDEVKCFINRYRPPQASCHCYRAYV